MEHIPVLYHELISFFKNDSTRKNVIVDATLGGGGHAQGIFSFLRKKDIFIGIEINKQNFLRAKQKLAPLAKQKQIECYLYEENFSHLPEILNHLHIEEITGIYYDLGISSYHLEDATLGISYKKQGPLDMRLGGKGTITAREILMTYSFEKLKEIFFLYGEEPRSVYIAKKIIEARNKGMVFCTTNDLNTIIETISKHPTTKKRIFQALRIEVNQELEILKKSLYDMIPHLSKGGKIFVISFHSGEDRIVKHVFREAYKKPPSSTFSLSSISKKPLLPTPHEIEQNPKARSAKARYGYK